MRLALPTALIVEDNTLIRMDTADAFSDAGFQVTEAWNGRMALDILQAQPEFDIVFTDVQMPGGIDGIDLAKRIALRWPNIAIMVGSGEVVVHPSHLPASVSFFPKPYDMTAVSSFATRLMS